MDEAADPPAIPIIDVAPFLHGTDADRRAVAAAIGRACRTIGFFTIVHHGVDMAPAFAASARFFALPEAEKERLSIAQSTDNRGYSGLGGERLDPSLPGDAKEVLNIGRERATGEAGETNRWPDLADFRDPLLGYFAAMTALCQALHAAFAIDLGLDPDHFDRFIDAPSTTLRLLYYPPRPAEHVPNQFGAAAHTDYGTITLLAQDDVGGLEVQARDGTWLAATPVAGAFVCNIGDILMRWTNDIYTSTPHRVMNRSARERYSIAFFFDPNPDAVVACLPGCHGADRPARYPPIRADDYLQSRLDATYDHRGAAA